MNKVTKFRNRAHIPSSPLLNFALQWRTQPFRLGANTHCRFYRLSFNMLNNWSQFMLPFISLLVYYSIAQTTFVLQFKLSKPIFSPWSHRTKTNAVIRLWVSLSNIQLHIASLVTNPRPYHFSAYKMLFTHRRWLRRIYLKIYHRPLPLPSLARSQPAPQRSW